MIDKQPVAQPHSCWCLTLTGISKHLPVSTEMDSRLATTAISSEKLLMKRSRTSSDHSPNPKRPRAKFPSLPSPATSDDLSTLLDLSALSDVDALLGRFDAIAAALLHEYDIVVRSESGKETILEPMEVEFYFWSELHRDAFTHGSEEQRIAGNW